MVRPDDITGYLDNKWFDSLSGMGSWITTIGVSILILATFYYLYTLIEHKVKVTVFPVYGARPETINKLKELVKGGEDLINTPNIEIGRPKLMRGKETKFKGITKFSLMRFMGDLRPRKLQQVPFEYHYADGVWMLNPAKNVFMPIPKPTLKDTVNIYIPETDMDLWQQAEEAEIRRRTQDDTTMKAQLYMTVGIIIAAFVVCGIIIWLSMSFAGKSIDNVLTEIKPIADSMQQLVQQRGPG